MAVARGKVVLHGAMSSGADVWQTGFHLGALTGSTQADIDGAAQGIGELFDTLVWSDAGLNPYISDQTRFHGCIVYDVNALGVTVRSGSWTPTAPVEGGYAGPQLPAEVAEVITLLTGGPGARNRGRMYFPALGGNALGDNGTVTALALLELGEQMANFLEAVRDTPDPDVTPSIYSGVDGVTKPITAIKVGNIFDSQRRRRSSQVETYTTYTL